MSMYLPNPDLRPTGFEMTEFIDVRPMGETATAVDRPPPGRGTDPPCDWTRRPASTSPAGPRSTSQDSSRTTTAIRPTCAS